MKDLSIFPIPQSIKMEQGSCPVNTPVSYECDDKLKKEEYEIVVSKEKITIRFSSEEGKFRANTTWKQILKQCKTRIPCFTLHDYPDFPVRGLNYCNGGRTPTVSEFRHMINLLVDIML